MSAPGKVVDAPMPSNPDAEKAVLGAMILDKHAIDSAAAVVTQDAFYSPHHQQVFGAILDLHETGVTVDFTTLGNELRRRGQLDTMGGPAFIASLGNYVVSTRHVEHHARIVLEKHQLRQLARTAQMIQEQALGETKPLAELLDEADMQLGRLSQQRASRDFVHVGDLTHQTVEEIGERVQSGGGATGVQTGYPDLDKLTGGFQKSDLIILAARPSMGKTALALNIALNVGAGMRGPAFRPELRSAVGIFSLEMSSTQVNQRLLSTISSVSMQDMRTGHLTTEDLKRLVKASAHLNDALIYVDDTPSISVAELRAKSRRLNAKLGGKLELIMVDYLQLMRGGGRVENRQQEIAEITRSLKALGRELNVPILALSQLSRLVEQRKGKNARRPMLSDLRESGAIEQDADVVMFIHRDKLPETSDDDPGYEPPRTDDALLIVGKQRNGPIDDVHLLFSRTNATFLTRAKHIDGFDQY